MTTALRASDRDLRALAGIVSADRPDLPDGEGLPPSLLADLIVQIRCDALSLDGWNTAARGVGPDFSERDRAVLTLLALHLDRAYLDDQRRRHPVPQLTPRHKDLLRLVAAGQTNAQIARHLGISEGTVRTHMENIYERLGVSSRAAAVTRAFAGHVA